jgi:glycosyltransferase involved in cell wall biosynthesis
MSSKPRIAFVVDALASIGGGEKVLFTALEAYPHAEVFTLVYNEMYFTQTPLANKKVNTSFINAIPLAHKRHRLFLPLMPTAIERFDLRGYDFVVCFSYAVAHGVKTPNAARHVAYMYTPMRYAWTDINLDGTRRRKNLILDKFMQAFRKWDCKAASRVHQFATISQAVSKRIADAYQRDAIVIYPPVDVDRFRPQLPRENYYITVTRLVAHKRVDLIVEAFSKLNLPLVVVGDGPEMRRLKSMANSAVKFLGYVPDETVSELMGRARGFVCATEEDFGIAVVEAQAAGCPVIAYRAGGALETVLDGKTGIFFNEQTVESLAEAIRRFEKIHSTNFIPADLLGHARKFSKEHFLQEFKEFVGASGIL